MKFICGIQVASKKYLVRGSQSWSSCGQEFPSLEALMRHVDEAHKTRTQERQEVIRARFRQRMIHG